MLPEQPVRIGELQPVVLQVELSVAQPASREALDQWVAIIEAVGSVAGQEVKVIQVNPVGEPVSLEARIEQHFKEGLDDFKLTPQEQRITELLVIHGKTGPEIAKTIGAAQGTVRNVISRVMQKTGSPRAGLAFKILRRHR